jgi:signal transduction histidine kinase
MSTLSDTMTLEPDPLLADRSRRLAEAQLIARLGSWSWDPDSGKLEVSPELDQLLRLPVGQPWTLARISRIVHPDDMPLALEALNQTRNHQAAAHVMRVTRGDGTMAWIQARTNPDRDPLGRVVGTWQDVTEREEAEQRRIDLEARLQRAQRLESVGQLAGGVAHEFNNVLAVLGMQAELALRALPEDHTAFELIDQLRSTIERATTLTRQLMVFSRHDRVPTGSTNPTALIDEVVVLLERTLGEHVALQVDHGRDVRRACIDRAPFEQVLLNLTLNARDAMPNGGTLVLRTRNLELAQSDPRVAQGLEPGPYVELIVSDTGTGMAPSVVDHAFEPFFSTKPKSEGTGLGLSTVYGIVRQAGGDVELVSELGAGTVVRLLVPADEDEAPMERIASGDAPLGRGQTVLVVEDQVELRDLVATVLAQANYHVVLAADGVEALVRAGNEERIELLLTDVVMPRMSGRELAQPLA